MHLATAADSALCGLYAIADLPAPAGFSDLDYALALLGEDGAPGPAVLQLRAKRSSHGERCRLLAALAPACHRRGVWLVVNDDVEAALAVDGVDGLHLGQGDLEGDTQARRRRLGEILGEAASRRRRPLGIGLSTHSLADVAAAAALPVDYLGFGPIFATASKTDPEPTLGLAGLAEAAAMSRWPVVAIGGLDRQRALAAREAGAVAVAMIGALRLTTPAAIRREVASLVGVLRGSGEVQAGRPWTAPRTEP